MKALLSRAALVLALGAVIVLTQGCAGQGALDRVADRVVAEADTPAERAERFSFITLAICQAIADGVDNQAVTRSQAAGDCAALRSAAEEVAAAAATAWFESGIAGATNQVELVTRSAIKRRAGTVEGLVATFAGPAAAWIGALPTIGRALDRGIGVAAMVRDYRALVARHEAGEIGPEAIAAALEQRWSLVLARLKARA